MISSSILSKIKPMALLMTARRIVVLFFSSIFHHLLSSSFLCCVINHTVTIIVRDSEAGAASHTPVIPQRAEKRNVNPRRRMMPLRDEMSAELSASPQLVKYIEFITSYPMNRNRNLSNVLLCQINIRARFLPG